MKVVFLEDVEGVAQGGEIKEVKRGFARNYLIPKSLATPATKDALQRTEKLTKKAEDQRLKNLADMKTLGQEVDGQQIPIEMRAGASGRLYGSVTTAIVADKLSEMTAREIERRTVLMPESIRETGKHDLQVRLHPDVTATVTLVVYPMDSTVEEFLEALEEAEAKAAEAKAAEEAAQAEASGEDSAAEEGEPVAEPAQEEQPAAEAAAPEEESAVDEEPEPEAEIPEEEPAEEEPAAEEESPAEEPVEEEEAEEAETPDDEDPAAAEETEEEPDTPVDEEETKDS